MKRCVVLIAFSHLSGVDALSSTAFKAGTPLSIATDSKLSIPFPKDSTEISGRRRCARCPDDDENDDDDMDRREALFAMLGSLVASMSVPVAASAVYGADAKIQLPNPIEAMANRQNGQCLVESLGNRECLVYLDPANKLYQGADNLVLLERVEKASQSLAMIPSLIELKKWSQVSGVLLGPLGTLVETMANLTKLSENGSKAAEFARKTKNDLNTLFQAVERKEGAKALAAHEQATQNLVSFVKTL